MNASTEACFHFWFLDTKVPGLILSSDRHLLVHFGKRANHKLVSKKLSRKKNLREWQSFTFIKCYHFCLSFNCKSKICSLKKEKNWKNKWEIKYLWIIISSSKGNYCQCFDVYFFIISYACVTPSPPHLHFSFLHNNGTITLTSFNNLLLSLDREYRYKQS